MTVRKDGTTCNRPQIEEQAEQEPALSVCSFGQTQGWVQGVGAGGKDGALHGAMAGFGVMDPRQALRKGSKTLKIR